MSDTDPETFMALTVYPGIQKINARQQKFPVFVCQQNIVCMHLTYILYQYLSGVFSPQHIIAI